MHITGGSEFNSHSSGEKIKIIRGGGERVGAAGRGGSASRRGRDLAPSRAFITTDSRSKSRLSERDRPPHRSSRGSRPRSIEDPALFAETIPPPSREFDSTGVNCDFGGVLRSGTAGPFTLLTRVLAAPDPHYVDYKDAHEYLNRVRCSTIPRRWRLDAPE